VVRFDSSVFHVEPSPWHACYYRHHREGMPWSRSCRGSTARAASARGSSPGLSTGWVQPWRRGRLPVAAGFPGQYRVLRRTHRLHGNPRPGTANNDSGPGPILPKHRPSDSRRSPGRRFGVLPGRRAKAPRCVPELVGPTRAAPGQDSALPVTSALITRSSLLAAQFSVRRGRPGFLAGSLAEYPRPAEVPPPRAGTGVRLPVGGTRSRCGVRVFRWHCGDRPGLPPEGAAARHAPGSPATPARGPNPGAAATRPSSEVGPDPRARVPRGTLPGRDPYQSGRLVGMPTARGHRSSDGATRTKTATRAPTP
jgi:hypothetical protein